MSITAKSGVARKKRSKKGRHIYLVVVADSGGGRKQVTAERVLVNSNLMPVLARCQPTGTPDICHIASSWIEAQALADTWQAAYDARGAQAAS